MIEILAQTWTRESTQSINFHSLMKLALPRLFGFDDEIGLLNDQGLTAGLWRIYGAEATFKSTKIPFHCAATDFHTGEQVILSEGNLARAIRASAGIPILFKPVEWNVVC